MKSFINLLRIGLLVLLITSCVALVSVSAKSTNSCGTIYVGETSDISGRVSSGDTIGWFCTSPSAKYNTLPGMTIDITNPESFYADPGIFSGRTGTWYIVDPLTGFAKVKAFKIEDPK